MRAVLTRCVAIAVAVCLACQPAWGHTFPPVRTVVVQVEDCEIAVLVGYRPASGEATETLLARLTMVPLPAVEDPPASRELEVEVRIAMEDGAFRQGLMTLGPVSP